MAQDQIVRTANVKWVGDVARGHGDITTASGKVSASYSFGTRFSTDPGTNPEELLAAVYLERAGEGYKIPKIELAITGVVPGVSADEFSTYAKQAEASCPISNALRAVPISVQATLAS